MYPFLFIYALHISVGLFKKSKNKGIYRLLPTVHKSNISIARKVWNVTIKRDPV